MEPKALSRGEGRASAPKRRAKTPLRAKRKAPLDKRKLVEAARARAVESSVWGAVYLDAAEFAEFEKCIQTPQKPTESIMKAAEMIRALYGKNR